MGSLHRAALRVGDPAEHEGVLESGGGTVRGQVDRERNVLLRPPEKLVGILTFGNAIGQPSPAFFLRAEGPLFQPRGSTSIERVPDRTVPDREDQSPIAEVGPPKRPRFGRAVSDPDMEGREDFRLLGSRRFVAREPAEVVLEKLHLQPMEFGRHGPDCQSRDIGLQWRVLATGVEGENCEKKRERSASRSHGSQIVPCGEWFAGDRYARGCS